MKKTLTLWLLILTVFTTATSYANDTQTDTSPALAWVALNDVLNDPRNISFLKMDLYNHILVTLSSYINSGTPITLNLFANTCKKSIEGTVYSFQECENVINEVIRKHTSYVIRNNSSCSDLVETEYLYINYSNDTSALKYISRQAPAYKEYENAFKEYQDTIIELYNIKPKSREKHTNKCKFIKQQKHNVLLSRLVERNFFMQSLKEINIPTYDNNENVVKNELMNEIGREFILSDSITCKPAHEVTYCEIKSVYESDQPISIQVTKQML